MMDTLARCASYDPHRIRALAGHGFARPPNLSDECCGAMLGSIDGAGKIVRAALPLENAFEGVQSARYELRPQDLLAAGGIARERHMDLIGIYHSHPDCPACFSPPICGIPTRGIPSWCSPFRRANSTTPQAGCPTSSRPKPPGRS